MNNSIAENTRRIIDEKGLKHRAVAKKAGMSDKQFSNLLCNRRTIRDADIIALAKALDVSPNELFGYIADDVSA